MQTKLIVIALLATITSAGAYAAYAEIEIPRSVAGDKGRYYLMESKRSGDVVASLHKRVGPNETGYTRVESNCATKQYREIGYSEAGPDKIVSNPTKWSALVSGSSKSDLFNFVCKK